MKVEGEIRSLVKCGVAVIECGQWHATCDDCCKPDTYFRLFLVCELEQIGSFLPSADQLGVTWQMRCLIINETIDDAPQSMIDRLLRERNSAKAACPPGASR